MRDFFTFSTIIRLFVVIQLDCSTVFRFVLVFDAWAKMPSGIINGNFMDFGSYAQCFDVKRNERVYETQYCLGHLTFRSDKLVALLDKNLFIKPPNNFPQ